MTKEELDEILNGMDEEEKRLTLAADDAYDALYSYQISKEYGVEVVCNPGGDRTKISIDGVVMNQEEFGQWLFGKQMEKLGKELADDANIKANTTVDDEEELPDEIDLVDLGLDRNANDREIRKAIKNYTGYFVAKDCEPYVAGDTVYDIQYGRKASPSELD